MSVYVAYRMLRNNERFEAETNINKPVNSAVNEAGRGTLAIMPGAGIIDIVMEDISRAGMLLTE